MRTLQYKLRFRQLEEQHLDIIKDYLNGNIEWLKAHNRLIPFGIYLAENGDLMDY
ncbi:MAG: hypothetical protein IJH63_01335 [Methanobrevibacter sp.]|nr:hypothetical protein [Methanobrevibacter sp.]